MLKKINKKRLLLGLAMLLILCQFKKSDHTLPLSPPENDFFAIETPPEQVVELMTTACYDCHSNHSTYPWYSEIAPISWWIQGHVEKGRMKMNLSDWSNYSPGTQQDLKEKSAALIEKNWMPILTYKLGHSEARMSDDERSVLIEWLRK